VFSVFFVLVLLCTLSIRTPVEKSSVKNERRSKHSSSCGVYHFLRSLHSEFEKERGIQVRDDAKAALLNENSNMLYTHVFCVFGFCLAP
jgi:hypothetical protein